MSDTDKRAAGRDASSKNPSSDKKEIEKKKRSRVKQLLADVKKQVEFWFGDANLHKDRFLKQQISESRDGYIDISVLTTFNKMKKLTTDVKLIARALKNSSMVEVNLEGTCIRRRRPLGSDPIDVDQRTIYVELLPKDVSHAWVERVFSQCGTIVYVSLPRYKSTGQPKGFAFVEFQTVEQTQKAIELLNNPPEDAPRKAGIFPKTKKNKPLPQLAADDSTREEDEDDRKKKKKKKSRSGRRESANQSVAMETSALEEGGENKEGKKDKKKKEEKMEEAGELKSCPQSKPSQAGGSTEPKEAVAVELKKEDDGGGQAGEGQGQGKTPGKRADKKRRRSQSTDTAETSGPGSQQPAKMRRVKEEMESKTTESAEESEKMEREVEVKREGGEEEEEEEEKPGEDSLLKAKRKRKKKHKERLKIGDEVIPLRVLSKGEWLELKEQYLQLQKRSMSVLKKSMTHIQPHGGATDNMDTQDDSKAEEGKQAGKKEPPAGPQFESGLIVKITHPQPLPGKKSVKDTLSEISAVVYVDILDGDAEGHVRFKSAEDAKAVMAAQQQILKKHNWRLEILSGDHEQRYWQKILVDRQAKLNRPRDKKRGTEKLIAKAEKIIVARAKEASKHIHFIEEA
ncbi:la-related protein 7 isoform X2 [Engraulis encrasicolus]|uniref:la-related protein 7 isoform X2 n=1 Tax=Engraulis encrasicolus TaxID=184585 RepID=UPI002FD794D7